MSATDPLEMPRAVANALERLADEETGEAAADLLRIVAAWIRGLQPIVIDTEMVKAPTVLAVHWPLLEENLQGLRNEPVPVPKEWIERGGACENAYKDGYRNGLSIMARCICDLPRHRVRG